MADDFENALPHAGSAKSGGVSASAMAALGSAARETADDYLKRQNALADLQMDQIRLQNENLQQQDRYERSHLWWRRFNDQMKGALQMIFVALALVVLIGVGAAVWSAGHADGLIIESFSVPPDMLQKGLSGEVIAGKVLDLLQTFQRQTQSSRAATSYANDWGNDIKVQIPNTGVSVGELNRYLHQWLGHETHISGEVYRTATGLALNARVGTEPGQTFAGKEAAFDNLVRNAAESIYRVTQPYRYAEYVAGYGRKPEAIAVYNELAATGPAAERPWAYMGLAGIQGADGHLHEAEFLLERATVIAPNLALPYVNLAYRAYQLEHIDEDIASAKTFLELVKTGKSSQLDPAKVAEFTLNMTDMILIVTKDFAPLISHARAQLEEPNISGGWDEADEDLLLACSGTH
ncbi:MAG TPA: hypothetical protein VGF97_19785, partial [Rhizomicrobium sp.]